MGSGQDRSRIIQRKQQSRFVLRTGTSDVPLVPVRYTNRDYRSPHVGLAGATPLVPGGITNQDQRSGTTRDKSCPASQLLEPVLDRDQCPKPTRDQSPMGLRTKGLVSTSDFCVWKIMGRERKQANARHLPADATAGSYLPHRYVSERSRAAQLTSGPNSFHQMHASGRHPFFTLRETSLSSQPVVPSLTQPVNGFSVHDTSAACMHPLAHTNFFFLCLHRPCSPLTCMETNMHTYYLLPRLRYCYKKSGWKKNGKFVR